MARSHVYKHLEHDEKAEQRRNKTMTRWRLAKIKAYMWLRLHLPQVAGYIEI